MTAATICPRSADSTSRDEAAHDVCRYYQHEQWADQPAAGGAR